LACQITQTVYFVVSQSHKDEILLKQNTALLDVVTVIIVGQFLVEKEADRELNKWVKVVNDSMFML
jgi:hypothetical protein